MINKGLPFMFTRYKDKLCRELDKFVMIIAHHDFCNGHTGWMDDKNLPSDYTLKPSVDMLVEGDNTFEFDSEMEMILFVSKWYQNNYPTK